MTHWQCYTTHCKQTGATRISDTTRFILQEEEQPVHHQRHLWQEAITEITQAFHSTMQDNLPRPASPYKTEYIHALQDLSVLFQWISHKFVSHTPPRHRPPPQSVPTPVLHKPAVPLPVRIQPSRTAKTHSPYAPRLQPATIHTVLCPKTGSALEYRHLLKMDQAEVWTQSFANELGRLAQGLSGTTITGTNTITFVDKRTIPTHKVITYGRIVVDYKPNKAEVHRTCLTVGGDIILYDKTTSTPTADLSTLKLLFNSVISTPGAKFMMIDISNFYLNSILPDKEYMQLPTRIIPPIIQQQYNLPPITSNGNTYICIRKGMYGLKQAGVLAYNELRAHLTPYGFIASRHTPGLWTHQSRALAFTLVVDDFGVKYTHIQDAQFLIDALQTKYAITIHNGVDKHIVA